MRIPQSSASGSATTPGAIPTALLATAKPLSDYGPQRREQRRVPHRVPCRVRVLDKATGETRTIVGETINLAPSGVALQIGVDVPVGTYVETLVPHAEGAPLLLCGTVIHSRRIMHASYEIGVVTRNAQDA